MKRLWRNPVRAGVKLAGIVTLCLVAASCVRGKPIRYYKLEAPAAPAATGTPSRLTLAIGTLEASPIMRDGRILYRVGNHEMGAYDFHRWVETPDRMIQTSLVRMLRGSGRYASVDIQGSGVRADYVIGGRIDEFSEVDAAEIHTRVSLEVEVRDVKAGRTVWTRTYSHEQPVQGKEVPNVVDSLDQNLKQGLSEIVVGLDQFFSTAPLGK